MSGLPPGFDPNRMTFNSQPVIEIRRNESIPNFSSYTRHLSLWDRFDNCIISIGNWFAENAETITGVLCIILGLCMAIPFVVWLFSLGWWGILAGLFLGGIAYYAAIIVIGIFAFISNITLAIIRYIFYNAWTFIITILIVVGFCIYQNYSGSTSHTKPTTTKTEYVAPKATTTKYRCTNSSLNVRAQPTTSSAVKGVIHRNDIVEVYGIYDGFGKIIYKGQTAYVGMKYLTPVN